MKRLEGKSALVTGATTGIGHAIVIQFAREGANVAINYLRHEEKAGETLKKVQDMCQSVREYGCRDLIVQADVSKEDDVVRMFQHILKEWGRIDIVVNNAGIEQSSPGHETKMEEFDRIIAVNLRGAFLCAREAIKHFLSREGGGVILNNSSVHEIIPKPKYVSYAVSKSGMSNLTKTLALEYAGKGIRVNAVGPGAIITPMNKAWIDNPERKAEVERHIPIGRAGTPEEMAAVFTFLASDEASYITGQTIFACGGLTLYPEYREDWSTGG
ncbi:MAG: glucose 1-dehydrogenase [wastewater metagenome]|nr:glucose 1-dehydrogenase [Candidatus Loosdrechtia aerotolerans]